MTPEPSNEKQAITNTIVTLLMLEREALAAKMVYIENELIKAGAITRRRCSLPRSR